MAYALVADVDAQAPTANSVTSDSIDTTGASLLIMHVAWYAGGGGSVTVSDSKSNTWSPRTLYTDGSTSRGIFYYVANPTVGTGHTFTASGTETYPSISVVAFSGAHGTPYDGTESGNGPGEGNSIQPGQITPSEANCLVVTGFCTLGSIGGVPGGVTGYTILTQLDRATGAGIGFAYQIQTSATATNPQWTYGPSGPAAVANIAAFRAGAGGGGGDAFMGQICLARARGF